MEIESIIEGVEEYQEAAAKKGIPIVFYASPDIAEFVKEQAGDTRVFTDWRSKNTGILNAVTAKTAHRMETWGCVEVTS